VVIGEFERAFSAGQARSVIAELQACGITVWSAEFDGPVDLADTMHRALLMLFGHQAEREVLRARRRTTAAMCAQVRIQGRHLGGRPPYGYRLVDAGPSRAFVRCVPGVAPLLGTIGAALDALA